MDTETHVFLVYLNVADRIDTRAPGEPRYVRSIREARCATSAEVHDMYDSRFNQGYLSLEQSLSPRPRLMRILVIDEDLPIPLDLYTLPTEIGADINRHPYDPDWFSYLQCADDPNPDLPHSAQPEANFLRYLYV